MKTREIIKKAMEILKSVKVKSEFDMMQDWYESNGYDATFDKQMKGYFSAISPFGESELHQAMCDVWNATLTYYYTPAREEECEIEKALTEAQRIRRSVTEADWAKGVAHYEVVKTNKGQKVLITYRDGSRGIRKLYEEPRKDQILNFDACEKELIDLAELGSHDYRSALAALVAKYNA